MMSEENLEVTAKLTSSMFMYTCSIKALHKIARKIRETKARLFNVADNLTDVITR